MCVRVSVCVCVCVCCGERGEEEGVDVGFIPCKEGGF